jgi:hypothetical protein
MRLLATQSLPTSESAPPSSAYLKLLGIRVALVRLILFPLFQNLFPFLSLPLFFPPVPSESLPLPLLTIPLS